MADAWIDGHPAALPTAIAKAARLLRASRMPVIAGLGTDVAGARAAIALAQQVGGAVDHMHSGVLLRDLDAMREGGMMVTTPGEARARADLLLLVGPGLLAAWPDLPARLLAPPLARDSGTMGQRRIVWLCPGSAAKDFADFNVAIFGGAPADLPSLLAALRARHAGRPARDATLSVRDLDALVVTLKQARFGVAVWSSAEHGGLTIEMLCGLVNDLNATTRFSSLPLAPPDNAAGVQQTCGWTTGFPLRTGFGRGHAEHDPWRFDAVRLVESGEADCALWISAYGDARPAWTRKVPLIALTATPNGVAGPAQVAIAVGRPGVDHDAVEYLPATGTLASVHASGPTGTISVADAVNKIAAAVSAEASC